ncbi:ribonuclease H-like domain-containing protein [Tanacetum coccineum]
MPVNTVRRSSRQTKLPTSLNDFIIEGKVKYGVEKVVNYANLNHESFCFASGLNKSVEPTCYEEAILDNNWIDAMNAEIEALNKNHTWEITELPANRKAIGIDFDETFSPVVKMSTVRCLIALSVKNKWPLFSLDVNNTFLYGDLEEDVYMTIPQRFADKDNKNKVCKLVKSFYGLKQAPRKWNEKLVVVLKENGFVQSANDLFTKSKDNKFIVLLVYVDDIVGRSSYARAMIELQADVELKDTILVAMPKLVDGNPLVPTGNVDSESEVKMVFDETTNLMTSTSFKGRSDRCYGTNSLLEQWRKSKWDDYYDPYDDDLYKNHDMSNHLQAICDDLDITVRGRKKK